MVNTYLYPVYGQFSGTLAQLSQHPDILGLRNAFLDRIGASNEVETVITVGRAAKDAIERWPGVPAAQKIRHSMHPSAHNHAALLDNWNDGLAVLRAMVEPELGAIVDNSEYGSSFIDADLEPIPRRDLPFGVPEWYGVGSHATRQDKPDGKTDPKRISWKAP